MHIQILYVGETPTISVCNADFLHLINKHISLTLDAMPLPPFSALAVKLAFKKLPWNKSEVLTEQPYNDYYFNKSAIV